MRKMYGEVVCSVGDCTQLAEVKKMCDKHYTRTRRHGDPTITMCRKDTPFDVWFWEQVDKTGDCWPWTRSTDSRGYGSLGRNGKTARAHVVAYELYNGAPAANHVLHSCDNPPCCNPAHLRDGTHAENMREAKERGRFLQRRRANQ